MNKEEIMKRLAKIISFVLVIALLSAISVGCGGSGKEGEKIKIALMVQGQAEDHGFNQSALNGLNAIAAKYSNVEVTVCENLEISDFEEYDVNFGKSGYAVVFGHGNSFEDAALKVAPDYPDTFYVLSSSGVFQEPNVCSVDVDSVEMGFLTGVFAGMYSTSKKIGVVGGMEIELIIEWANGVARGAAYVDPSVQVLINYTGSFEDSVAAKELAKAMIEQGADIMLQNCDPAGAGVLEACQEKKVTYIGAILDQYDLAPEVVATSGIADLAVPMVNVFEMIQDDTIECKNYILGAKDGAVYLAEFRGEWANRVSAEIKETVEKARAGIADGSVSAH